MPKLHLVDAHWIWTEPHSMRFKLHLTVRYTIENVPVQQRVQVELKNQWKQCPDCNREFTNRTWHALVQVRQAAPNYSGSGSSSNHTSNHHGKQQQQQGNTKGSSQTSTKRGLAALEMALAQHTTIRKHVLKIDTTKNGFDFYFLNLAQAQAFASYLQRCNPMRSVKSSSKLVSTDVKNNTANLRHTLTCELVPLCRDDLVLIKKQAVGGAQKLAGRLVLVDKVSSVLTLLDASPTASYTSKKTTSTSSNKGLADYQMELSAENYYRNEKNVRWLQSSERLVRFVVLDVESLEKQQQPSGRPGGGATAQPDDTFETIHEDNEHTGGGTPSAPTLYQGPQSGVSKYALAEVVVVRESELGVVNDHEPLTVVTHLGHLLQAGDVVLGYDLERTVGGDWELDQRSLHHHFVLPDVVLVKKAPTPKGNSKKNQHDNDDVDESETAGTKKSISKKREKRRRRKEGKKMRALEESAARMGFLDAEERGFVPEERGDDDNDASAVADSARSTVSTQGTDFEEHLWNDPQMAAELHQLETALEEAAVEVHETTDQPLGGNLNADDRQQASIHTNQPEPTPLAVEDDAGTPTATAHGEDSTPTLDSE